MIQRINVVNLVLIGLVLILLGYIAFFKSEEGLAEKYFEKQKKEFLNRLDSLQQTIDIGTDSLIIINKEKEEVHHRYEYELIKIDNADADSLRRIIRILLSELGQPSNF